jgi:hypothetical protein
VWEIQQRRRPGAAARGHGARAHRALPGPSGHRRHPPIPAPRPTADRRAVPNARPTDPLSQLIICKREAEAAGKTCQAVGRRGIVAHALELTGVRDFLAGSISARR